MRRLTALSIQVILALSVVASSLAVPLAAQSAPAAAEPAAIAQSQPVEVIPAETGQVDPAGLIPAYGVVQNADPYLTSLALGYEQPTSRYGPVRNNPDEGIPRYAYSPFQEPEKRETCPPGGCDYVAGQLLIKFAPDSALRDAGTRGAMPMEERLLTAMDEFEILSLTPIFPDAEKPLPGERIATVDGELIPAPDLTLWYRAETRSTESLGTIAQSLVKTESIEWVEPDFVRKPIGMPAGEAPLTLPAGQPAPLGLPGSGTDPLYDQQWHLSAAYIPQAWAHLENQGLPPGGSRDIVVAVIDTGVDYTHPDLAANMWVNPAEFYGTPGVDDDGNGYVDDIHGVTVVSGQRSGDPQDDHGHGTHVAGIIAAQTDNGIGGVGVAYNVQIMAIKAAQYSGVLAASDIAEGIYYAISKGADVINMSFGGYGRSQVEEDALAVAFGQAVLVAAAGNDAKVNLPCPFGINMYPAAYNWVLGVMASDSGGSLAGFSNSDCIPHDTNEYELMAPGVGIYSTLPGKQYAAWSGTSMAAPIVSGIAALARTQWADKDVYSSRFIMGQIASNTSQPIGGVANALTALSVPPKPELSYLQHWLFDTPDINPINDNDGIVDAGETIDLAIMLRNHWGKASDVTVTLEAWAEGAFQADPYVTMITDTVDYGAIGSFNWKDNGLIYDAEGAITGVAFPFRFSTSPDTPNDHIIPFKLTITGKNGYDPDDPEIYTAESRFFLLVQRRRELPKIINEDMTLSKDYYWLVPDAVLIAEGATVTVTEGTQIQFWSIDPEDPYSQAATPYLQVEGNLFMQGSATEPVELFTGLLWKGYPIEINQKPTGHVTLRYAKIANPYLSEKLGSPILPLDLVEHTFFSQDFRDPRSSPTVRAKIISQSIFKKLGGQYSLQIYDLDNVSECLFDTSVFSASFPFEDSVFLINNYGPWSSLKSVTRSILLPSFLRFAFPTHYDEKTYVAVSKQHGFPVYKADYLYIVESLANVFNGHVVAINDEAENQFVDDYRKNILTEDAFNDVYSDMECGLSDGHTSCWDLFSGGSFHIGLTNNNPEEEYRWLSGEPLIYTNWSVGYPNGLPFVSHRGAWYDAYSLYDPFLIELPGIVTEEQLNEVREQMLINGSFQLGDFFNNAILNVWWKPDTSKWMRFGVPSYIPRTRTAFIYRNFWSTTSTTLIDAAIHDFYDDFNLCVLQYQPILTEAPETAYPFVVDVLLNTEGQTSESCLNGPTPLVGAEPVTFTVTFNRDMDQDIQPQVSFGPDVPITDYTVHPVAGGWADARTWVGTFNITPYTGDGYQLIRVAGAVAADDPWLVTGDDAGRFRFQVETSGTAAMNLQAAGGEGAVDLTWSQTDFDLLAGFNLYRAPSINGAYARINTSIIPPDTRAYRDKDVIPGQSYFYKFTVIKTDMSESDFSNIASATPIDTTPPTLHHTPVTSAHLGHPLTLSATVTDNVAVTSVTLYYRLKGVSNYKSRAMVKTTGNTYYATLEGSLMTSPGIEYYIEASDGINITRNSSAERPNYIQVGEEPEELFQTIFLPLIVK